MVAKRHRLGDSGIAVSYMSRKQALKKLQLSIKDFRRLCILKGIYPAQPHHKKKVNKNNSSNKTYYFVKDVKFLAHEPLIEHFRAFKVFVRRLKKAIGRKDSEARNHLRNHQPIINLDHIVKERYPTFIDALRDMDDALSMCFLFSTFPKSKVIKSELIMLCRRITVEFLHYVVETKALRKVFVSIKGIYYQAEIMGQQITWIIPHTFGYEKPNDVDFKIMLTFAQFYSTMLGFINYKLYSTINLVYPPKLATSCPSAEELLKGEEDEHEYIAAMNISLKSTLGQVVEEEETPIDEFPEGDNDGFKEQKEYEEKIKKLKNLFVGCKIFLNREVPKESLIFVIRCFGGEVSFDKDMYIGATFDESDTSITHQIIDRPLGTQRYINRIYIQPQWVYDSVNARMLLPVEMYFPGEPLPPHLSPFVEEKEGDYIPPEKKALLDYQSGLTSILKRCEESSEDEENSDKEEHTSKESDEEDKAPSKKKRKAENKAEDNEEDKNAKMKVTTGRPLKLDPVQQAQKEAKEEKQLQILAMHKKDKHLYRKIIYGQKRKNTQIKKMQEKRANYEKQQKAQKKAKKA